VSDGAAPDPDIVVKQVLAAHAGEEGALLEILIAVQEALGYVPPASLPTIAHALNLSRADVHGVVTFYHELRTTPPGRHVVKLCRAEACQAAGADALAAEALGPDVTVEPVYCLGCCATGPAALVDGELVAPATLARLTQKIGSDGSQGGGSRGDQNRIVVGQNQSDLPNSHLPVNPSVSVFVPRDAAARARGADAVAAAIAAEAARRGRAVRVVRNGSRGMLWLEPLVEVETARGRVAYGPVAPGDVARLVDGGLFDGQGGLGPTDELSYLARQERVTFARVGLIDPLDLAAYAAHGGWAGLRAALERAPAAIVDEVTRSGLRGRGGAAFPTGIKWRTTLDTAAPQKYVVCNADEGDSGTFSDRLLMEGDPFTLLEGMAIAGLAVGATRGFIYLRSEYPDAYRTLGAAIDAARAAGFLGRDVLGSGRAFDVTLRRGAGSYVCGEETALLESLEGKRGEVRYRPPVPAERGLFGRPTALNNVVTLASVPAILARGADWYRDLGVGRSRGTLAFQLAGNVARGGLVEKAFGLTLRNLIDEYGGGTRSGRPVKAVQVGGPLGAYLTAAELDVALDYEALAAIGGTLGHGGVVVFDDTVDMAKMARYAMEFCSLESCGKCTPCRIGSTRGVEVIDRLVRGERPEVQLPLLRDLCDTMTHASLCAMGGMTPNPVLSAVDKFPEDFRLRS